jgi:hypothetical protein
MFLRGITVDIYTPELPSNHAFSHTVDVRVTQQALIRIKILGLIVQAIM